MRLGPLPLEGYLQPFYLIERLATSVDTALKAINSEAEAPKLFDIGLKNGIAKANKPDEKVRETSCFFSLPFLSIAPVRAS